jgi:Asp-tRNA(Asn)/Glu-tRNA(Gln) amidotransferase A subunit family amidase
MSRVSRRELVKAALAVGVTGGAASGAAAEEKVTPPEPDAITKADIAAADKIAGRTTTESERKQMLKSLTEQRKNQKVVRTSPLAEGMEPAFHFEPRLPGTPLPTGKSGATLSRGKTPAYSGDPESLAFLTVAELARLVKARKVTCTDLTRMCLHRLKKYGPRLLCVVSLTEEKALEQAARADREIASGKYRGPLHGIPYGVKDLFAARGTRTTYGAPPYKDQVLDYDSTVVARLEEAGAVLCAKFTMGELAMGDVWFGGTTRNPWDPTKGSSGSSAGSASATAAGLIGFSIGTETLGSITSPSRVCGTTGLRPTYGRVSRHGAMALSWTMDKIGPICRGVEDCALVFAALHGADGLDPTAVDVPFRWNPNSKLSDLRVGIDTASVEALKKGKGNEEKLKPWEDALAVLETLGVEPKPVTLPARNEAYGALTSLTISVEGAASFAGLAARGGLAELVQQDDWNWPNSFRASSHVPASDYIQAMRVRAHLQHAMAEALKDVDVYVTVPLTGPSISYTNLCGQPTVITRAGRTKDGLPISIEFTGNLYREDAALHLAYAYEQATPWHTQWPDVTRLPETPPKMEKG